jgi:hypothetical protein
VSDWLLLVVLSLATYRLTRLAVRDDFPPVLWVRDRLAGGWRPLTTKEVEIRSKAPAWPKGVRPYQVQEIKGVLNRYVRRNRRSPAWLADLVSCPWCASGWISLVLVTGSALTVGVPAPVLTWPAVWAVGALTASREWS